MDSDGERVFRKKRKLDRQDESHGKRLAVTRNRRTNADTAQALSDLMASRLANEGGLAVEEREGFNRFGLGSSGDTLATKTKRARKTPAAKITKDTMKEALKKPAAAAMLMIADATVGKTPEAATKNKAMTWHSRLTHKRRVVSEVLAQVKTNPQASGVKAAALEKVKELEANARELFKISTYEAPQVKKEQKAIDKAIGMAETMVNASSEIIKRLRVFKAG